jgi:hypothetical protein
MLFSFGESNDISDSIGYIEQELKLLSDEENRLYNSNYSCWIDIERTRENFYQTKLVNRHVHIHSDLLRSLNDASQIDQDISNLTFNRSIRPFLFECYDQRQILQLLVDYLFLINGQPRWSFLQEILNHWRISLSNHCQEQLFIEYELLQLYPLIHSIEHCRTEKHFSMEYVCRIYEHILDLPSMKTYQIDFLLLYWYYLADNVLELKQSSN